MKKISILILVASASLVLSACSAGNSQENGQDNSGEISTSNEKKENGGSFLNICQQEKVNLPNYGDPGKRLKSCFVEYPGEPTREDKSYYVLEDICGQFTKEFMENMIGQKIIKIESPNFSELNNCSYYLNDKGYLLLNLEYLSIDNQKKGNEMAGRKTEKNQKIPIENLVVTKDDVINEIYFVLGPQKFLSASPNMKGVIGDDEFINFAVKFGEAIKNYK